jgi:hypothetical protein
MGVFDNPAGIFENIPALAEADIGTSNNRLGTVYVTGIDVSGNETISGTQTADAFLLADGSDKNVTQSVYAAGTVYALTATSAAIDFGTTDPVITFAKAGTYLIQARVNLEYAGATFAANRTVTIKLRRTNNTAADLTNGSTAIGTDVVTTVTGVLEVLGLPTIVYAAAAGDIVTIFGDVSVIPTAGALNVTEASIVATRLYA